MGGISIPGVTDQYNTNDTVEKLMKVERIPLAREQDTLKSFQAQRDAWRDVNKKMSALRDSVKLLYSHENPFNNKLASSSDEKAVTAEAGRSAAYESFKIEIAQSAAADRMLSDELPEDQKVAAGSYIFKAGEKSVKVKWKGGSLKDFSAAVNKRGGDAVKSSVIGSSAGKKTLLVESLVTGGKNRLTFDGDAKQMAIDFGIIAPAKKHSRALAFSAQDIKPVHPARAVEEQAGMPELSGDGVSFGDDGSISIPPRSSFALDIPQDTKPGDHISFDVKSEAVDDVAQTLNLRAQGPSIPDAGSAEFADITVSNEKSDALLPPPGEPLDSIQSDVVFYALMQDGSEVEIPSRGILDEGGATVDFNLDEYEGIARLAARNRNTGASLSISVPAIYDEGQVSGLEAKHPVESARDAIIKYEGITMRRDTNDIDDVVPFVTLHARDKTDGPAVISIKPDTESSKDALITFVGKYNEAMAEINVLSQNKSEIIDELTYLSDDEKDKQKEKLGMFLSDFSLSSVKNSMQSIESSRYAADENAKVTMLSQIGISTNASGGSQSYSAGRLRGYLEIDEKKLDSALENDLDDIKNMFGYDSDGDLTIDSGIAWRMDKLMESYVRAGGVLATKTSGLDSQIKSSEKSIARLEAQLDKKENQLRQKYAQMEGSLNSLESQQTTISNFQRQNSGRDR